MSSTFLGPGRSRALRFLCLSRMLWCPIGPSGASSCSARAAPPSRRARPPPGASWLPQTRYLMWTTVLLQLSRDVLEEPSPSRRSRHEAKHDLAVRPGHSLNFHHYRHSNP